MGKPIKISVQDTVPGRLPRKPESEWKPRKAEVVTVTVHNYADMPLFTDGEKMEIPVKEGLYLEDILIWCSCRDNGEEPIWGPYVHEEDGTHGVVCRRCWGVLQLG